MTHPQYILDAVNYMNRIFLIIQDKITRYTQPPPMNQYQIFRFDSHGQMIFYQQLKQMKINGHTYYYNNDTAGNDTNLPYLNLLKIYIYDMIDPSNPEFSVLDHWDGSHFHILPSFNTMMINSHYTIYNYEIPEVEEEGEIPNIQNLKIRSTDHTNKCIFTLPDYWSTPNNNPPCHKENGRIDNMRRLNDIRGKYFNHYDTQQLLRALLPTISEATFGYPLQQGGETMPSKKLKQANLTNYYKQTISKMETKMSKITTKIAQESKSKVAEKYGKALSKYILALSKETKTPLKKESIVMINLKDPTAKGVIILNWREESHSSKTSKPVSKSKKGLKHIFKTSDITDFLHKD